LVAALVIEDSLCTAPDEYQPLLLILARNLVTNLALPALLTDADARLIFFNEAAALILGQRFEEVGRLRRDEWATRDALWTVRRRRASRGDRLAAPGSRIARWTPEPGTLSNLCA
jgi:PAS domain-containing protein